MYDIYLSKGSNHIQDMNELVSKNSVFINSGLQTSIKLRSRQSGFLGLDLPSNTAAELLESLTLAGARGLVVASEYRQPKLTVEMAYAIACAAIAHKKAMHFSTYTFEPVKLHQEAAMWWEFIAISEELIQSGNIPGRVDVRVDKLDGHIWTSEELVQISGEEYYLESATNFDPKEILKLWAEQLEWQWVTDEKPNNQTCLKGSAALSVSAVKHTFPQVIENKFGFRPTTHICFRIAKYKTGYDTALNLMLQATKILLDREPADAVLLLDAGNLVTVFKRVSTELLVNQEWYQRNNLGLFEVGIDGKIRQLSQPAMST
jgi:hypothetical protein